ncbi:MAG: radical SAM protein [Tepidanaerobacteraceae bacterium]|jgi:radical SAM superfamily enzyme YgiQ (UPF0313 family)|nr:radical SAM protein [Tepidanaerobacteraceae bacterium]
MRVLLLNPPFLAQYGKFSRNQRSPAITKAGTFYYPIWLAYATGVLEREGHEVKLVDAVARRLSYEQVEILAKEFCPEVIVVETSTPSIYNDVSISERLKKALGHSFILLVGTHPSALPKETLQLSEEIDGVARGEYDYIVRDVARALSDAREASPSPGLSLRGRGEYEALARVSGLSFRENPHPNPPRGQGGRIRHNPDRAPIENLDELPFVSKVYKRHLNVWDYFFGGAQYPMVHIISGRGCPNRCVWCVWPQTLHGRRFRARSAENVVDEMEFIAQEMPEVKDIGFEDDTFTVDQKRVVEICDLILARGLKVSWYANVRVNLRLETMLKMKAAGCRFLIVGFESGSPEILKQIRKGITVNQSREFMKNARKAGLLVHGCMVAGNPGETKETLQQSLDLAMELNPDTMQFFPMMVYPGTEAYQWAKENGYLITQNFPEWITPEGLHNTVVTTPELSAQEVVEWCDNARRQYYLRPSYLWYKFKQTLFCRTERERNLRQFKSFYRYLLRGSFNGKYQRMRKHADALLG